MAAPVPTSSRVRRPDGDVPLPRALPADAPAIPFELGGLEPSAHAPAAPPAYAQKAAVTKLAAGMEPAARPMTQPNPVRPASPIQLAAPLPREHGTMAGASQTKGASELREQLRVPIAMVGLAIAISLGDLVYTRVAGELFTVGSFRPMWITAPLALIGVGMAAWRVLGAL